MKMKSPSKSNESSNSQPTLSDYLKAQEAAFRARKLQDDEPSTIRRELFDKIDETKKDLESQVDSKLTEAKRDIDTKAKDTEANLDKKVLEARNKIIEPLAIFVGLFTFVSIGFQVFTQVREYILWMPILGAVLGGIVILAGLVLHASSVKDDVKERRRHTGAIMAIGFAIFIASGFYYHQAAQIIRAEDMKECIVAINKDPEAPEDEREVVYCKLKR